MIQFNLRELLGSDKHLFNWKQINMVNDKVKYTISPLFIDFQLSSNGMNSSIFSDFIPWAAQ